MKKKLPWQGKIKAVKNGIVPTRSSSEAVSNEEQSVGDRPSRPRAPEPILRLRGVGRRFGGLHAVRDVDLDVAHGERRAILGPNGAGKTTLFNVISGDMPTAGTIEFLGEDVTRPARTRAKLGMSRTYQKSRLFLGLSVEDNLYLALLGIRAGHLRPLSSGATRRCANGRARPWAWRRQAADARRLALPRRAAPARGGDGTGREPKLMMLDEPASGLSRGERVLLTDLLLGLDRSITLILIEHDMDVALRVAEVVTMMHDGRTIVEGTPAEIRANQIVHDLYLGRGDRAGCRRRFRPDAAAGGRGPRRVLRERPGARGRRFEMGRESVAVVGRNGMGKTTLCQAIMGLTPPADGSIRFAGEEILGKSPKIARRGIGYVPQGRRLFPSLTVDEHLRIRASGPGGADGAARGPRAGLRALPAARGAQAQRWRAAFGR